MLSYYCEICGERIGDWLPKSESDNRAMTPEYISKLQATFANNAKGSRTKTAKNYANRYEAYLDTEIWKDRRKRVITANPVCQCCNYRQSAIVHHKRYERVDLRGSEPDSNLVALCMECHTCIHDWNPYEHALRDGRTSPYTLLDQGAVAVT